jgi:hypothetical protein
MKETFYIVRIYAGVEPCPLIGPYETYRDMLKMVKKIYTKQSDSDSIFYLVIRDNGVPVINSFSWSELE